MLEETRDLMEKDVQKNAALGARGVVTSGSTMTINNEYGTVNVLASFLQNGGTLNVSNASHVVIVNDLSGNPARLTAGTINISGNAYVDSRVVMATKAVKLNFSGDYSIFEFASGQFTSGLLEYFATTGFNQTSKIMVRDYPANTYMIGISGAGGGGSYSNRLNFLTTTMPGASLSIPFGTVIDTNATRSLHGESDGSVSFSLTQCFLRGALIETPVGSKAIETIRPGDLVMAFEEGGAVPRRVIWTGRKTVIPSTRAQPLRVVKDAFAPGIPFADLVLTDEHCLFLDGAFIPCRMLVNDRTIHNECRDEPYEVYHIEVTRHSVIKANGLLTESYLDTGTRSGFDADNDNDAPGLVLCSEQKWNTHAAAPLNVSRAFVEPIHKDLLERAIALGAEPVGSSVVYSFDASPAIRTQSGEVLMPYRQSQDLFVFSVPAGVTRLWLVSKTGKPSEAVGPFIDDRRDLGVLVSGITQFTPNAAYDLLTPYQQKPCPGWHDVETCGQRWTSGNALIVLEEGGAPQGCVLAIRVIEAMPHPVMADACLRRA